MGTASTNLTASARNSGVYIPFGIRSICVLQIVKLHDASDSILSSLLQLPDTRRTRTSRPYRPRLGHLLFFAGDNIGVRKLSEFFTHEPGANTGFSQPIE